MLIQFSKIYISDWNPIHFFENFFNEVVEIIIRVCSPATTHLLTYPAVERYLIVVYSLISEK